MTQERYPNREKVEKHSPKIQAKVILAKCPYAYSKSDNLFGIRVQKEDGDWVRTWAFKINAEKAAHEGYDRESLSGTFSRKADYPGCPYCHTTGFAQCACGHIFCMKNTETKSATLHLTCPWCKQTGEYTMQKNLNIQGGGY